MIEHDGIESEMATKLAEPNPNLDEFLSGLSEEERYFAAAAFDLRDCNHPVTEEQLNLARERRRLQGRDPETGQRITSTNNQFSVVVQALVDSVV